MRRDACAACGGNLTDFLDLGSSPPADRFPPDADAEENWYPLQVAVCEACWLAQLRDIVPDDELYGPDYGFRTGSSPAAVKYFGQLAWDLLKAYGKRATVEIACNDGTFLQSFKTAGCPVTGIDPSGAAADAAAAFGEDILAVAFSHKTARQVREARGPAGLVLAFNVAAHVTDPLDFLGGVRELLSDDGVAVIEFQDLAALIAGCQYDHVYHEHRFFYSLTSFSELAAKSGLQVASWQRSPAQGGSLRVHLRRSGAGVTVPGSWLRDMTVYAGMQDRARYARLQLQELLRAERDEGRVVAGFGASAKSATLFSYCQLGPSDVQWVADITPGKIGRVTPGSHIPVYGPGKHPDTYLLASWNYLGAVIRREREFLAGGGRFIVPGAVPALL